MNSKRKGRTFTTLLVLLVLWAGCDSGTVAPIESQSGDATVILGNLPAGNILAFDSFTADGMVKVYWRTGLRIDPPFFDFKEVRLYISSTGPDSGFREILRRTGSGEDSTSIDGLTNGTAYYFRVATYDSAGQPTSVSRPLMTIPGAPEPPGISLPAPQGEIGEWVTNLMWSHDGQRLAFLKSINSSVNVFVLHVSSMSVDQITRYVGTGYRLLSVHWSPDDQLLSYCYTPTSMAGATDYRIWLVPSTGGSNRSITSGRVDAEGVWESSTTLIFTKGTVGPPNIPELYRVDLAEGNREIPMTADQSMRKYDPSLNIARALMVFRGSAVANGNESGLFILPLGGGVPAPLTWSKYWSDIHASWSADGQRIYFTSSRSGHFEIWSIDVQSKQLRQVTRSQIRGISRLYGRHSPNGASLAILEVGKQYSAATIQIVGTD
jgi:WD40 repeat protein